MQVKKNTRQEQKERTRASILQAALEEFSRNGYDGTNVRAIGDRAKVNHGLIKYYFGSKENLWKEAVGFMFERQQQEVEFEEADSLVDAVKSYIRSYTRYCARHPEHPRIMIQASMHSRERLQWAVDRYLMPHRDSLVELIEKERAAGVWPNVSNVSLIYSIVSACQMIFALAAEVELLYGVDVYDEKFVDSHAEAVIQLVLKTSTTNKKTSTTHKK